LLAYGPQDDEFWWVKSISKVTHSPHLLVSQERGNPRQSLADDRKAVIQWIKMC
jgi:hypothetical protein